MSVSASHVRIALSEEQFGPAEREIASFSGMHAYAFRFPSGVAALRIVGKAGEILALPFQGQQIWDAVCADRRLTMETRFEQPLPVRDYLSTYGAFMIHCGAAAMGNPGPSDDHPLHGELPNAPFEEAALLAGEDAEGPYMALTGTRSERRAFGHDYTASPTITMHRDHFRLRMRQKIANLRHQPLPVLYLLHLNFRPVAGAQLIDCVADDGRDIVLREGLPAGLSPSPDYARLLEGERSDPGRHRAIGEGDVIDPELVMMLSAASDAQGWTHALQRLPDGEADFISFRWNDFGHAVRWIVRTPEMQALGLLLPATARPDGRAAALASGEGCLLPPGETFQCTVHFGVLDQEQTSRLEDICASVRSAQHTPVRKET